MALGPRSLRTKKLTERVPAYAPRTVYRHTRVLSDLGLIDREEIAGVPSSVIHSLSAAGRALYLIMTSYAELSLPWAAGPSAGNGLWPFCGLLGDMWASGWIEQLSHGGRSATELTEGTAAMTFHQVSRRTQQMVSWGLLYESHVKGGRKRYQLSDQARHGMALVSALGRWRQDHATGGEGGLDVEEMATVLRTSFLLLTLPERRALTIKLGIVGTLALDANASGSLTGHVSATGAIRSVKDRIAEDAWALGTVDSWFAAILDGNRGTMRVGGDLEFADEYLKHLHEVLWVVSTVTGAR
jgi:DNA-binding HxlR family transcriptional regulator